MEGCVQPCILCTVSTIFADFGDFGGKFPAMILYLRNGIICKMFKLHRSDQLHSFLAAVKPPQKPKKLHHFSIFMRNWWSLMFMLS